MICVMFHAEFCWAICVIMSLSKRWNICFLEKLYGMKVVVTGDSINRHEKTVVLLNHRTRLDWLYFMSVVFHMLILNRQKIALKSMLKQIPGIGKDRISLLNELFSILDNKL